MSLAEIEAELTSLKPEELRALALKSWSVFVQKEGRSHECSEDDPELLAALDEAIERADASPASGHTADAVRSRLRQWTSR